MSTPDPQPKTVLELITMVTELFRNNHVESPRLEAELLLAHVLGIERIQLYVRHDQPLGAREMDAFREVVRRRGRHEPVHYILGRREFWSLDIAVEKGVLIPRPDTECLVEEALEYLKTRGDGAKLVADIGTGSGAIAIALATEVSDLRVWAGDVAAVPLRVAADNAERHGVADRVTVVRADLLRGLSEAAAHPFDAVVSNPPYISEDGFTFLPPHVRQEPREALVAGADGLEVVRRLVAELPGALEVGGAAFIEIGADQGDRALEVFRPHFKEVRVRKDYAGHDRVIAAIGFEGAR